MIKRIMIIMIVIISLSGQEAFAFKCKPNKGVTFNGSASTRFTDQEIKELLVGNTLVGVDRWGSYALYYTPEGETIGWMPKEKNDWSRGNVTFKKNKYCRTWKEWKSGKTEDCWELHKGPELVDSPSLYFVCGGGVPDGDANVVLEGNALEVSASGNGSKTGKIIFNKEKAKEVLLKYFGKYKN